MGTRWTHRLTEIDTVSGTAQCSNCGPVELRSKIRDSGTIGYDCVKKLQLYRHDRQRAFTARLAVIKLAAGCMDCGYRVSAVALDFDHRDSTTKSFTVGKACNRLWERVLIEIDKCDVVCANCHRIRTADRRDCQ
jgi:hypothetical protein